MKVHARTGVSVVATMAAAIVANMALADGRSQKPAEDYGGTGALFETFRKKKIVYDKSEHDAVEQAERYCSELGDRLSEALDRQLKKDLYDCHMDRACKNRVQANYEAAKKKLIAQMIWECDCKERAIEDHYGIQRIEAAKRARDEAVRRIDAQLLGLDGQKLTEDAAHVLKRESISSQPEWSQSQKADAQARELKRHQRRLAEIAAERNRLETATPKEQGEVRRVIEAESQKDLNWLEKYPGRKCH